MARATRLFSSFASSDFRMLGEFVVVVGNSNHDRLGSRVLHVVEAMVRISSPL
jgi:hypothetical protein